MCEIAITDYQLHSTELLAQKAMEIYQTQRSSLGLVAIHNKGDKFDYRIFKSVEPEYEAVHDFVMQNDDASRLVIHGRMATHGAPTVKNAHPLNIKCEKCHVDYVVHNGVIYGHKKMRQKHKGRGHDYETPVDSEVLAHAHGDVPDDFDESRTDLFSREPAFILLNRERIYIYNGGFYELSERGYMAQHRRRDIRPRGETEYVEVILRPGAEGEN